mmetsp:Transcript_3932/g.6732  ORF Transcript_3932/g.6732 Transcript_3932/m.6732 type:complete len:283 (-) Transcript_3932:723-1571(-)
MRFSASAAAAALALLLASTTSFRSSTLNALAVSKSLMLGSMFLGTEMSKNLLTPPTSSEHTGMASTSSLLMRMESELEAAKTTSESATHSINFGLSSNLNSTSGNSSASSSHLGIDLLTTVILLHPLEYKCLTRSFDIFPAPMMHTFEWSKEFDGSLSCASSAAALLTDTAPLAMSVSLLTLFPAWIACLNKAFRCLPKPPALNSLSYSEPSLCTFFTWARICPSPITSESRPPLTLSRCLMASLSLSKNKCGLSSSIGRPLFFESQSSISLTPLCQLRPTA